MAKKIEFSLIIPCYNEEKRLSKRFPQACEYIKGNFSNFEIVFINDGSKDNTEMLLNEIALKMPEVKVVSYSQNQGKGYALKKGIEIAQGEIIAFTDADFSISLSSLKEFKQLIEENQFDMVIGSRRELDTKALANQSLIRRFLGKTLAYINNFFLNLGNIADTQCGIKAFKGSVAKDLFSSLQIYRWLFDIEILMLAKKRGYKIQKKVVQWEDIKGSKVNILADVVPVGKDLLTIYYRFINLRIFLGLLVGLTLIILFPFILNPQSLVLRNGDYSDLVWPNYYFIKQTILKDNQIPLWNPTLFSGIPEIANPQSPLIYPLNMLTLILPLEFGIVTLIFIHVLIGGYFSYLLGKNIFKFSSAGILVLGLGFIFSPFLWSKFAVGHLSQGFAILLLPPIIYFAVKYYLKFNIKDFILTVLFLSAQYLNYPTIWYYSCFFGLMIAFIYSLLNRKLKGFIKLLIAAPLSILLILPVFLIQLQAGPLITRSALSLNELSLPLWSIKRFLLSVLVPSNLRQDLETEVWLYPGISLLILTFISLFQIKVKKTLALVVALILAILITLGNRTILFSFFVSFIPGFSYLRVSTRVYFIIIALISLLAAIGIERINKRFKSLVLIFVLFDLFIFSLIRIWFIPPVMQTQKTNELVSLLISEDPNYRYYCTKRCLSPSITLPRNINTADGYHLLLLRNYQQQIAIAGGFKPTVYTGNIPAYEVADAQPSAEKLGKFAVKWLISNHPLNDNSFIFIKKSGNFNLYENTLVLPRVRISGSNKVSLLKETSNFILIKTLGEGGDLVLADNFYPGWYATIDNRETEISLYKGWARTIKVPKGEHLITFSYNPFRIPL